MWLEAYQQLGMLIVCAKSTVKLHPPRVHGWAALSFSAIEGKVVIVGSCQVGAGACRSSSSLSMRMHSRKISPHRRSGTAGLLSFGDSGLDGSCKKLWSGPAEA